MNNNLTENEVNTNYIGFKIDSSPNNSIIKNKASNNKIGIILSISDNSIIARNNISKNLGGAILLRNSNSTIVENNIANNNSVGIFLQESHLSRNANNNVSYNKIGEYLNRSYGNTIMNNRFSNNKVGLALNLSQNNNLSSNYFKSNEYDLLTNENMTISGYLIWNDVVLAEHPELYFLPNDKISSKESVSTETPVHVIGSESSPVLRVYIDSNPRGSEIYIDGKDTKTVTLNEVIFKKKRTYNITLTLKGYKSAISQEYISSSNPIRINLSPILPQQSSIKPSDLNITIDSVPRGAGIWINNEFTGKKTPDKIYFDTAGYYNFELNLTGYEDYQGSLNLSKTGTKVNASLVPIIEPSSPGFPVWLLLMAIILIHYPLGRRRKVAQMMTERINAR
jgi:parallel beta-helix repeat protein